MCTIIHTVLSSFAHIAGFSHKTRTKTHTHTNTIVAQIVCYTCLTLCTVSGSTVSLHMAVQKICHHTDAACKESQTFQPKNFPRNINIRDKMTVVDHAIASLRKDSSIEQREGFTHFLTLIQLHQNSNTECHTPWTSHTVLQTPLHFQEVPLCQGTSYNIQ